jgi:hypothetical protein
VDVKNPSRLILSDGEFRKYRSSSMRLSGGFHVEQRSGVYVLLSDSIRTVDDRFVCVDRGHSPIVAEGEPAVTGD